MHGDTSTFSLLVFSLWEEASMCVSPAMTRELVESVTHPLTDIRIAACKGLATALAETPDVASETFTKLLTIYQEKIKVQYTTICPLLIGFPLSNSKVFKFVSTFFYILLNDFCVLSIMI